MAGDEVDAIVAAWHHERPDLDVSPLQIMSRIDRLAAVLARHRATAFAQHGLQIHEFDVLSALRRAGEPFERTAGELAALTHVTSGTMTSRLDKLESRELVTRRQDPSDLRLVRVGLTGKGRRRVDAAVEALAESERGLLAGLPAPRRAALEAALRDLLAVAKDPGG